MPGCQRPSTFNGAVFGDGGTVNNFSGRNSSYKKEFVGASRGTINFTLGGELAGANYPQVTGKCVMGVEVFLMERPTPDLVP